MAKRIKKKLLKNVQRGNEKCACDERKINSNKNIKVMCNYYYYHFYYSFLRLPTWKHYYYYNNYNNKNNNNNNNNADKMKRTTPHKNTFVMFLLFSSVSAKDFEKTATKDPLIPENSRSVQESSVQSSGILRRSRRVRAGVWGL